MVKTKILLTDDHTLVRVSFKLMSDPNRNLQLLGFLPTMVAEQVRQHLAVNSDITRQFGAHRVLPSIRSDIRLAEAFAAGKPIRQYAATSRGAQDFTALAATLSPLLDGRAVIR